VVVNPMTRGGLGDAVLEQMRPALAHAVGAVFVVGLVFAIMAMVSAFLVPAGQARDLAVRGEGITPSSS
ncbi:MAG TPA: hypothetical protein VF653_20955, partial [Methylomirabilota bacterium]